jgi:hypothetical protein
MRTRVDWSPELWRRPGEFDGVPESHDWPAVGVELEIRTLRKIPVLLATRAERGAVHVRCWYCEREHTHSRGDGHRIAHCAPGGPFERSGYMIRTPVGLA